MHGLVMEDRIMNAYAEHDLTSHRLVSMTIPFIQTFEADSNVLFYLLPQLLVVPQSGVRQRPIRYLE